MNSSELDEAVDLLSRRLPVRAFHHIIATQQLDRETLEENGISDATILDLLSQEGVDVQKMTRDAVVACLDAKTPLPGKGIFETVDPVFRDAGNPLVNIMSFVLRKRGLKLRH